MFSNTLLKTSIIFKSICKVNTMSAGKTLQNVVAELEKFAPISTAESWDNVGLLIEPYKARPVKKILLTNDLTESVMQEAVDKCVDMIISYHPPIFTPMKRITQSNWKERIVSICLAESIALYSPHTSWDAACNGVNDWLGSALPAKTKKAILPNPLMIDGGGSGRIIVLGPELTLRETIETVQKHIGLDVHVAMGVNHDMETIIKTAALCAGSGSSVLKGVVADLYLTGEMSHHEILDANHRNTSVILCNHSNSERGFLKHFRGVLFKILGGDCEVDVSEKDEDPLKTYKYSLK